MAQKTSASRAVPASSSHQRETGSGEQQRRATRLSHDQQQGNSSKRQRSGGQGKRDEASRQSSQRECRAVQAELPMNNSSSRQPASRRQEVVKREGLAKEDRVLIGELTKRLVGWRKNLGLCTEENKVLRQEKKVLQRQLAELTAKMKRYEQLAQRLQNLMPKEQHAPRINCE